MNTEGLKEVLVKEARAKGICMDGYSYMNRNDIDALIDYYITHPDWCLERNYPSLAYLKEHFSNIEDRGVYVGHTFHGELLNERQAYIFHNCKGTIKVGLNVKKVIIPMLYFANGCRIHIVGTGDIKPKKESERTIVPLYIFGQNDISARDNRYVKYTRYKSELI